MGTKQKVEPRVMLQGRILYQNHNGVISDATRRDLFGLKSMAENGELALDILDRVWKKLTLLKLAAEGREQLDASLVRLAVEDVLSDLENGSELASYVGRTQELFANATALSPHAECVTEPGKVLYEICDTAPDGDWEPLGFMYDRREDAERELAKKQLSCPTAFLARVVMTRADVPPAQDQPRSDAQKEGAPLPVA